MSSEGPRFTAHSRGGQDVFSLLDKVPLGEPVEVSFMHRKDVLLLSPVGGGGGGGAYRDQGGRGKDCLTPRDAGGNPLPTLRSDPFHQPGCA